jgi:hypothetical protein
MNVPIKMIAMMLINAINSALGSDLLQFFRRHSGVI